MHVLPLSAQEIEVRLQKLPLWVADTTYNAVSEHPQSGIAVAQAATDAITVAVNLAAANILYASMEDITKIFEEAPLNV